MRTGTSRNVQPQCGRLHPLSSSSFFCSCQHLFDDRAYVVVGGAVVGNAGPEPNRAADARVREPDPTPLVYSPQDLLVALVQLLGVRVRPAEADGAQLDRSKQLER